MAAVRKAQPAPNSLLGDLILARLYSYAGRGAEARAAAAEVRQIEPNFSLMRYVKNSTV